MAARLILALDELEVPWLRVSGSGSYVEGAKSWEAAPPQAQQTLRACAGACTKVPGTTELSGPPETSNLAEVSPIASSTETGVLAAKG